LSVRDPLGDLRRSRVLAHREEGHVRRRRHDRARAGRALAAPRRAAAPTVGMKREADKALVTLVDSVRPQGKPKRALADFLFGRRLTTDEEEEHKIGPIAGVPVLGLDALSSAAYGPEAALTLLLPIGALGLAHVVPITGVIIALLLIVYFSY